uniref:hypothetical protein n=1 Tax=Purpureocillium takamizusanense TaxID=2060973 RepID=UPI001FA73211|nr:hypothetical protein MRV25_mgp21 [Purpureocillium takamizusanense]UNI92572.1 hypothetical protein [Purpureocillium takamizusanense]
MKKFFNTFTSFFKRFFTPINLSKVIVIFFIGLISRFLINDLLGINVFTDYLNWISLTYYSGFAAFIVFVHEYFSFFKISIIPNFVWGLCSKLSQILEYLFVRPFIWVYSRTWGKNVHMFHMNDPRNSSSSIYMGNEQHHYSSVRSYNVDSFYNRIAQQNPYQVQHSSINRVPHPSHYPPYEHDYYAGNYNQEYVDHNVSQSYEEDTSRFFCIDTIQQNGIDRSFITPINQPNAPRMSNNTTPSTMTPLFDSTEQVHQCSAQQATNQCSRWSSDTSLANNANQTISGLLKDEIDLVTSKVKGTVSLGVEYLGGKSNIQSLYIKYHDLAKRKFFWNIWEKNRSNHVSYEEFKKNFDPNMNIWREIYKITKSDLSKEIQELLDTNPFGTKKISSRDIRKVNYTKTQKHLNEMNARRYKSARLPKK